ncbi:OmpA family protein [Ulvibacter antarcticus]|uniref:WD40 repeat protein n=1 Tax=Ulvibacter antarcticus TaxID=442714 RepID=A0A3L9Z152_9FLAO|nr:OmpA family protein [Ulvibacter antarcticus]RMA65840.1 WD40 repeat protein [Ulvibacter antarcticus]
MKNIYTILLFIALGTQVLSAQNSQTKKADELYDRLAYVDAAEAYQKLLKKGDGSSHVYERLANSYYFVNDTKKAEPFYKRVVQDEKADSETVYNYAQSLKANGKFSEYNTWMKKFATKSPSDSRAIEFMKNPDYVPQIVESLPKYDAKNLKDINTKFSEFGGITNGKDFYFSSARNTSRKKYAWNEQPFLDIYKASIVGGTVKNANLLTGDVNTKYHEGNMAITADGKRMYFDRNDYFNGKYKKSEEGVNQINLYYTEKVDGNWKGVFSVPFNTSEYSVGHPALSPDGNTLYFVSDMPGGKGSSDIYKVSLDKNGVFGTPVRLGDNINTEGKEVFPFIDANGNLLFSSDGHMGLGGLDGFYAEANGFGFSDPVNLGNGANSPDDDFAFNYDPNTKTGYLSSNRKGGKGSDDIYGFAEIERPCSVAITARVVTEEKRTPIAGARVDLYDSVENKLSTKTTDANGVVVFDAACDQAHVLQASAEYFESNATDVDATSASKVSSTIVLRPIDAIIVDDKIALSPIYFDFDKHNIRPKAAFELDNLIQVLNKYPQMIIRIESHTDNRGTDAYNMNLSERRAKATTQYLISKGIDRSRLTAKWFGESNLKVSCGGNCTEQEHQQNRRSDFIIEKW